MLAKNRSLFRRGLRTTWRCLFAVSVARSGVNVKQFSESAGRMERSSTKRIDFDIVAGANQAKTVDFMYTVDPAARTKMNQFFMKNWARRGQSEVLDHLQRADFVPLDFRNLDQANQNVVLTFLKTLSRQLRAKAIVLELENDINGRFDSYLRRGDLVSGNPRIFAHSRNDASRNPSSQS